MTGSTSTSIYEQIQDVIGLLRRDPAAPLVTLTLNSQDIQLSQLDTPLGISSRGEGDGPVITKRHIILYYLQVAPLLLPLLKDRPLTVRQFPHGISQPGVNVRHVATTPSYIETVEMYSEHTGENEQFLLCQNLNSLLWLVNQGAIEFYPWQSRILPEATGLPTIFINSAGTLDMSVANYPDYMVFRLQLEQDELATETIAEAGERVRLAAIKLRDYLARHELTSYVKTGSEDGFDILVPIERRYPHEQVRAIAQRIGQQLVTVHPDLFTNRWELNNRLGKVFIDSSHNMRNKSVCVAYSLDAQPGIQPSLPLSWESIESNQLMGTTIQQVLGNPETDENLVLPTLWRHILKKPHQLPEQFL